MYKRQLHDILDYDPSTAEDAKDIIIPIGDAYNAFIANEIVDETHFGAEDAKPAEKAVYAVFEEKRASAVPEIIQYMQDADAAPYNELSSEMQAYLDYVSIDVLLKDKGILISDAIDTNDETYQAWTKEENINLYQYLNYAISQNWIDTCLLYTSIFKECWRKMHGRSEEGKYPYSVWKISVEIKPAQPSMLCIQI